MKPEIILPTPLNPRVPAPTQPFRTVLPLQIRFNDIDLLGHVNNEMYFAYMDLGKMRYFQEMMDGQARLARYQYCSSQCQLRFLCAHHYRRADMCDNSNHLYRGVEFPTGAENRGYRHRRR